MLGDKRVPHNGGFHDRFVRTFKCIRDRQQLAVKRASTLDASGLMVDGRGSTQAAAYGSKERTFSGLN